VKPLIIIWKAITQTMAKIILDASPLLVSPAQADAILRLASHLPKAFRAYYGLECRLDTPATGADFLLRAANQHLGPETLSHIRTHLPEPWSADPAWVAIERFAKTWRNPESPIHTRVDLPWLEFDTSVETQSFPTPNFFFGVPTNVWPDVPKDAPAMLSWIPDTALPVLRNAPTDPALTRTLFHILEKLPRGAGIFQVGLMMARPASGIRICLSGLLPESIPRLLEQIQWPGQHTELRTLLKQIAGLPDVIALALDISDQGVLPNLGLECYMRRGSPAEIQEKQDHFWHALAQWGLCQPNKAQALTEFRGFSFLSTERETSSSAAHPQEGGGFQRWVHHIKLARKHTNPWYAKAYLAWFYCIRGPAS
jgi:hypothetical protein